jgi:hypothetical protein
MRDTWKLLAVVCALVIGVYGYMAQSSVWELWSRDGSDSNYNLLVQGFQAGHLSLKKEVPPGFASLADPFDPAANLPYRGEPHRINDLSYYKNRFYFYFGVTPALILFWPYVVLTGQYLFHRQAVLIFCTVGFLSSVGLLRALWRRSKRWDSGGLCIRTWPGRMRAGATVASGFLRSSKLLWIHANNAGTGCNLVCVTRAGAEKV